MIRIKEKKKSKKKPYYLLEYDYMIGDANGDTSEKVNLSLDNPYIEKFVTLINKLKPLKGTWGIVFEGSIFDFHNAGQLTEEEYEFLDVLMFEDSELIDKLKLDDKYAYEFLEGVRGETEYSFLVFKGATLYYFDEFGEKHDTKFVN